MLITNGKITRNISAGQLPEYKAKGYTEVKVATDTTEPPAKPKAPLKGKK